jgi:hypothetical protein
MEDSLNQAYQELEKRIEEIQKFNINLKKKVSVILDHPVQPPVLMDAMQENLPGHAGSIPVSIILADIDHFNV